MSRNNIPKMENLATDEDARQRRGADFIKERGMEGLEMDVKRDLTRNVHEQYQMAPMSSIEKKRRAERDEEVAKKRTWRANVPILCWYEYFQLKADTYPYIRESEKYDDVMIRGVSMTPRLSEYPGCRDIIKEYYACRDDHRLKGWFNLCSPVKEQLTACINITFLKQHKRGDKKLNDKRHEMWEEQRERKLQKLLDYTKQTVDSREKFQD